jgi:hypothetical protein
MHELRLIPSRASSATRRRWRMVVGLAALAMALTSVTDSSAAAKAGPGDPMGHPPQGGPPGGGRGRGGIREQFGGPRPEGKGPDGAERDARHFGRGHEQGVAGAPGMNPRLHGPLLEARQKRAAELKQKEAQGTLTDQEKQELWALQQPRLTMEQRKARMSELEQKQASGKLTAEEQAELDRGKQMQVRREAMEKRFAEMAQNRKNRARDAKRQALKEHPNLGKDANATAEYQKHAERLAKLERAKEVAVADQRTDVVTKIDALIAQENQRHQAWLAKNPAPAAAPSAGASQ